MTKERGEEWEELKRTKEWEIDRSMNGEREKETKEIMEITWKLTLSKL